MDIQIDIDMSDSMIIPSSIVSTAQELIDGQGTLYTADGVEWYVFDSDEALVEILWLED